MPSRLFIVAACAAASLVSIILVSTWLVAAPTFVPDSAEIAVRQTYVRPSAFRPSAKGFEADKVWGLGQKLFFDTRLSASATMSCASCHQPDQSWTDHLPRAVGDAHRPLAFRAPTLLNAGQIDRYGWTGRFEDIEAVAFFAMSSPANMNTPTAALLSRLAANPSYAADFRAAFADGGVSKHHVAEALTRYVRSIVSDEAPFDRWIAGDTAAISPSAARGFAIFNGKGRCAECHGGWAFTDGSFHDIGTATGDDLGRGKLFRTSIKLQYAFKTPTLRNVAARAPYMHGGSIASLAEVVDHYDRGGIDRPSRAEAVRSLGLSGNEKKDLVAFLETLTSGTTFIMPRDD